MLQVVTGLIRPDVLVEAKSSRLPNDAVTRQQLIVW